MQNFEAISYSYTNLPNIVLQKQKEVFDKFNLPLTQIISDIQHGAFLEQILKTTNKNYIIFFDVDCIPLTKDLYDIILNEITTEKSIIGIEQTGEPRYHIYAGPACLGLPVSVYHEIGQPKLQQTFRSDTAEEITWCCEERAIKVKYFKLSHVEKPKWKLGHDRMFGIGTTYSFNNKDILYHQFEVRYNYSSFINKCNSILNNI
jgi:hypothetical protein